MPTTRPSRAPASASPAAIRRVIWPSEPTRRSAASRWLRRSPPKRTAAAMNTATGVSSTTNTTRTMSSSTGSVFSGCRVRFAILGQPVHRGEAREFQPRGARVVGQFVGADESALADRAGDLVGQAFPQQRGVVRGEQVLERGETTISPLPGKASTPGQRRPFALGFDEPAEDVVVVPGGVGLGDQEGVVGLGRDFLEYTLA